MLVEDNHLNVKLILSLFSEHSLKLHIAENGSVRVLKSSKKTLFRLCSPHVLTLS
jgi:hypothetical protein